MSERVKLKGQNKKAAATAGEFIRNPYYREPSPLARPPSPDAEHSCVT